MMIIMIMIIVCWLRSRAGGLNFHSQKVLSWKKDILTVSERVCSAGNKVPPIGPLEHWGKENSTHSTLGEQDGSGMDLHGLCKVSELGRKCARSKYWSPKEKISTQPKHLPSSVWVDFGLAGPKTGGWCRRTSGDNDPPVGFGRHLISRKESHIWSAYSFSMLPVRIYYLYVWFGQNHNQARHFGKHETHESPSK